ncbi:protein NRT1/ PTR FAMILY 2.13-like [Pyrus x bretschneideri]|uniref:protein NRT1/ PTR FAMILY 2.13-like n=1 Tax=Pyrus x bretschneideri TaxID=225117 RepID=UPI00202F69EA|nr:protein NRT1/ PTR FAMILY 2.13-like [Pyrus x bretschneideri]
MARDKKRSCSSSFLSFSSPKGTESISTMATFGMAANFMVFLKKAAREVDNELKDDGSCTTPSRLCSIQQVEEVIHVMKILPSICFRCHLLAGLALAQEPTVVVVLVSQAMKMDRHVGLNFGIPAASAKMMSIMTLLISLTLCDRVLQRALTKFTKCEGGIPHLVSNKGELWLHHNASSNGVVATSVFWLFPQQMLLDL